MKEYNDSFDFWNKYYTYTKNSDESDDSISLGAAALEEQLKLLSKRENVLDFGSGSGWASIFLASFGAKVTALEPAANGTECTRLCAADARVADNINAVNGDDSYLDCLTEGSFDGFFSCNTFDVIPEEVTERALQRIDRVLADGASVLISLNPDVDIEWILKRNAVEITPKHYAINGILRIVLKSEEEWLRLFGEYFNVQKVIRYKFDFEPEGLMRRLFVCTKK
ncbi:MAG: class I SAM-dependent methyltransferase [Clostridia bacterium]|nr:class I SAM-dependent methyltransferase [Clostridia bacterium]